MVLNAQKEKLLTWLAHDLIEGRVAIVQYANDIVFCFEHDLAATINLKLPLYIFELMSGLKINFLKSEILYVEGDDSTLSFNSDPFNCQIGHFPMKYLGVPFSYSTLRSLDCEWRTDSLRDVSLGLVMLPLREVDLHFSILPLLALFTITCPCSCRPRLSLRSWISTIIISFGKGLVGQKRYHLVRPTRICRS